MALSAGGGRPWKCEVRQEATDHLLKTRPTCQAKGLPFWPGYRGGEPGRAWHTPGRAEP